MSKTDRTSRVIRKHAGLQATAFSGEAEAASEQQNGPRP